jgi:hypothetical protein
MGGKACPRKGNADHSQNGVEAMVDLGPIVAKGKVFTAMQDPGYFVERMRVADDRLGLEWPDRVDFSADGLRFTAFPDEAADEFGETPARSPASAAPHHAP